MKIHLQSNKKIRIEMIPLIDMIFLILVSFIYAMLSMAVHRGLPVVLPISKTSEVDNKPVLSVTLKADGTIYLDKKPILLENLKETLQQMAERNKDPGVLLFADRTLSYQKLFQVLDQIRLAGLNRISLQAEAEQSL